MKRWRMPILPELRQNRRKTDCEGIVMEIGKVPENVLKRAIFKQIHTKREEVLVGAGVGEDCAVVQLSPDEVFVLSTDPITGTEKDMGSLAIQITANDLASAGAEPVGVLLTVLLPPSADEPLIRKLMGEVETACGKMNIQVMGGHTEITAVVNQPLISVTGVGKIKKGQLVTTGGAHAGDDVIVSKWIGIEGTSIIAKEREEELKKRFAIPFIEEAKQFDQYLSVVPEGMIAVKNGVTAMHDVTEGGIYGALWELAEASGVGLEIDLKKIPIRQETVEICECFRLNPYQLISSGCMLMTAPDGQHLVKELQKAGIKASIIGQCVEGKAKKIINGEDEAFLERPKTDELYKIYEA
jgi:thiamin-phosphate kinase